MPATGARKDVQRCVVGVDGCPKGWLAVRLHPHEALPFVPELRLFTSFADLLRSEWGQAALIMVDMPIGLAEAGPRVCDRLARQILGRKGTSVFAAPRRLMLALPSWAAANRWGQAQGTAAGGGLSKQAWHLIPKIRDLDQCLTPDRQRQVRECHPELAFSRLNGGAPVLTRKRKVDGAADRRALLEAHGLADLTGVWQRWRATAAGGPVSRAAAIDDFHDACALALTSCAVQRGDRVYHLSTGARDARGLVMEIWG